MKVALLPNTVLVPAEEYHAFMAWRSSVVSEEFTTAERRRHQRGLAEIARGDYVTLDQLKHELAHLRRQSSPKKSKTVSKKQR